MSATREVTVTLAMRSGREIRVRVTPPEFGLLDDWYMIGKARRFAFKARTWASDSPVVVSVSHDAVDAILVDVPE